MKRDWMYQRKAQDDFIKGNNRRAFNLIPPDIRVAVNRLIIINKPIEKGSADTICR